MEDWVVRMLLQSLIERLRRKQRGFTLVELLLVLAILGVLAAVVSISVVGLMGHGEEEAYNVDERTIQLAVSTFYSDKHAYAGNFTVGWNRASGYTSVHNYPAETGEASELYAAVRTQLGGYQVWEILGFTGSTPAEKRAEIEAAAIWMGLLVNGPGDGEGLPPTKDNAAPLDGEHGPYLNPLPDSCGTMNCSRGSGSITWIVGAYGRVYGVYEADSVWYAGYGGRYP